MKFKDMELKIVSEGDVFRISPDPATEACKAGNLHKWYLHLVNAVALQPYTSHELAQAAWNNLLHQEECGFTEITGLALAESRYGQIITSVNLDTEDDGRCIITFESGSITLYDDGRNCCEHRFITTDDDITSLVGSPLTKIELLKVEVDEGEYETHEIAFVHVHAGVHTVTLCTHNEHNGYYGGFNLTIEEYSA